MNTFLMHERPEWCLYSACFLFSSTAWVLCFDSKNLKIQFRRTEVLISLIVEELLLTLVDEWKQHSGLVKYSGDEKFIFFPSLHSGGIKMSKYNNLFFSYWLHNFLIFTHKKQQLSDTKFNPNFFGLMKLISWHSSGGWVHPVITLSAFPK